MHTDEWRLQDAKAQFSQVVEAALGGAPQHITRRGKRAVVVLSEAAFEALQHSAKAERPRFIDHLLAMPRDDQAFEEASLRLREPEF